MTGAAGPARVDAPLAASAALVTPSASAAGVTPSASAAPSALAEQVRSAFDYIAVAFAGYAAGVAVVTSLFWHQAPWSTLLPWYAAFLVLFLPRLVALRGFRRALAAAAAPADLDWPRWRLVSNVLTLAAAAFWGVTAWIFYPLGNPLEQTGLVVVVYTFSVAAVPVLSVQPRLYVVFASLCFLPMIARIASVGDLDSYQLAAELVVIIVLTNLLARNYRQTLNRVIQLKLQADTLLVQLRTEKAAADAARQQAEVANRAKTQFFTAASHDLRQPLHAMGLFAEALRQRVHEPEVAQLVNSINESVDALEGLFSELLDITRIDTGGVEVHAEHFTVADIFRKLRLHFEPAAFEKGLALRLRGGARAVHADPLLVERILRNLVSNAIRYTHDGSVLVSCRQRAGQVLLQVWDTGPGIPADQRSRIFEEFYQLPSNDATAPNERKGLGLGLAIVKRLADLMQAPLALQSRPGHGTVFTLALPLGRAVRAAQAMVPGKGPLAITLAGRLIVIVEDEPAVRAGLEVLLRGWGAEIASFESVRASAAWAEASDPVAVKPDLLIVDYRLEEGLTGVDAISALRRRFGPAVPAILVTGSTMTGHENEAQEHDFHLLIKPVVPNKLRAMIAFKLGVKASG